VSSSAALWLTVVAIGLYHGLNPAMGWPLAVANGMTARRGGAVFATLLPLGGGHFIAMAVVLLPFAWLSWVAEWDRPIRIGAGLLVVLFGVYKLIQRRHPRVLARIRPTQLAWWSFLMATAHGAGLMIAPALISIAAVEGTHHHGVSAGGPGVFLGILAHTIAMLAVMSAVAWLVYRHLGLAVLRHKWINFDLIWAVALLLVGALSLLTAPYPAG